MLKGIDISHYQGAPNFDNLKTQTSFVIIKATEGIGFIDPQFKRNQQELRRVGLLHGFYHFARPNLGNTPQKEVDYFLQVVGPLQDGEILVLDIEVPAPTGLVDWSKKFLDYLASKLNGYKALIYLNKAQITSNTWKPIVDAGYGVWVASYDNKPEGLSFVTPWSVVAMKQYTSSGAINGIPGKVDLNAFYGDAKAFLAYGYKKPVTPPVNPPTTPINDQTKYDFGPEIGIQEMQAMRSMVLDLRKKLAVTEDDNVGLQIKIKNAKTALA